MDVTATEFSSNIIPPREQPPDVIELNSSLSSWHLGMHRVSNPTRLALEKVAATGNAEAIMEALYSMVKRDNRFLEDMSIPEEFQLDSTIRTFLNYALQADVSETQAFFGELIRQPDDPNEVVTDVLFANPQLHPTTLEPNSVGQITYFGFDWQLPPLPVGARVTVPTFGVAMIYDQEGNLIQSLHIDPRYHFDETIANAREMTPQDLLTTRKPIDETKWTAFTKDLPGFWSTLENISAPISPAVFSMRQQYDLWAFWQNTPADVREQLLDYTHNPNYGLPLLYALNDEFNTSELTTFVKMLNDYSHDRATSILLYNHTDLVSGAILYASKVDAEDTALFNLTDSILQDAQNFLKSALLVYKNTGSLQLEDIAAILSIYEIKHRQLALLASNDIDAARQLQLPFTLMHDIFHLRSNPETQSYFKECMNFALDVIYKVEAGTDYAGKVPQITQDFYNAYAEMERNANQTTADTPLEIARYVGSFEHDQQQGMYEGKTGINVGFVGIGTGKRVETHIIDAIRAQLPTSTFTGFDLRDIEEQLPGVQYEQKDMVTIGDSYPATFDRLSLIWSPFMDVLEVHQAQFAAKSLATALKDDGIIELDLHFPYGEHSYERLVHEYHTANPSMPQGLFERSFDLPDGTSISKPFFAYNLPELIHLFEQAGLETVNIPDNMSQVCENARHNDEFIQSDGQDNIDTSPLYRTSSGMNRITIKFQKKAA